MPNSSAPRTVEIHVAALKFITILSVPVPVVPIVSVPNPTVPGVFFDQARNAV